MLTLSSSAAELPTADLDFERKDLILFSNSRNYKPRMLICLHAPLPPSPVQLPRLFVSEFPLWFC